MIFVNDYDHYHYDYISKHHVNGEGTHAYMGGSLLLPCELVDGTDRFQGELADDYPFDGYLTNMT